MWPSLINTNKFIEDIFKLFLIIPLYIASECYVDYKTGVMIQTRPNGREITCRTYSVDPGKQHLFRGVKK